MKIRGTTVSTPTPKPDWNQTDPSKADYIKNKPIIVSVDTKQNLTDSQKALARENIGAASVEEVLEALPLWQGGSY